MSGKLNSALARPSDRFGKAKLLDACGCPSHARPNGDLLVMATIPVQHCGLKEAQNPRSRRAAWQPAVVRSHQPGDTSNEATPTH